MWSVVVDFKWHANQKLQVDLMQGWMIRRHVVIFQGMRVLWHVFLKGSSKNLDKKTCLY
jgi:hypothetical protein